MHLAPVSVERDSSVVDLTPSSRPDESLPIRRDQFQSGELRMKKLPAPDVPGTGSSFNLVAGARLVADAEHLSTIIAHWRYQGVKHAEREMVRVGMATW